MPDNVACYCGQSKHSWQAFCPRCFGHLPATMIDALNRRLQGAHGAALDFLVNREAEQEAKRAALTFDPTRPKTAKSIP